MRQWFNQFVAALFAVAAIGCVGARRSSPAAAGTPLEQKLAQNPDDPQVNIALGEASEGAGDLLRAEQYYLRAEALGVPQDRIVPRLVRVLVAAHRYDEALDRCRRRLTTRPEDRATRFVEAALLVALERPKEAERELAALVRTKPDDPQAYLALGKLYRDGYNDRPRARAMFEKYLELAPSGEAAPAVRFELADEPPAAPPATPDKEERP
ncbi:MAG TPA: tetratricopeptide repeat protein [Polyangia bacterium]|nr:tetratricopeptide repeat protein [Polyangia bacterium]